jgi:O-antigen ligase
VAYVAFYYLKSGNIRLFLNDRFGFITSFSPNWIAEFLDLSFPVTLFIAIWERKKKRKYFFIGLSVLYFICMLLTSSRGSVPGLLVIALFFVIRHKSFKTLIIISLILVFAGLGLGSNVTTRLLNPSKGDLISNLGRIEMLRSGSRLLKENKYFFGISMNNFTTEKFKFGFPLWLDHFKGMSSHNTYLEFWLGWGLLGLIGWLLLTLGLLYQLIRCRLPTNIAYLKLPFIFALVAFLLHGFFDSIIALPSFLFLLFSLLASMSYIINLSKEEKKETIGESSV